MNLARLRRRAAGVLWVERLGACLLWPVLVLLAYAVLALFGAANGWLFLAACAVALGLLGAKLFRLRAPSGAEIDRRIETASGLKHRPLAALQERPATGGAEGAQIWALHQARLAAALATARAGWPRAVLAPRDPYSLRALLALLLLTGLVINFSAAPGRLASAFRLPGWPFAPPGVTVWVTPPAYTGQGPALLPPGTAATVLRGTRLSVILDGSHAGIRLDGQALPRHALGADGVRADGTIMRSGRLTIGPWWHRLGSWPFTVTAPVAPVLVLDPPKLDQGNLQLSWLARDPYGLKSLRMALEPVGHPDALPEGAALPTATGQGQAALDVQDSPYAGLPVSLSLRTRNLAGIAATSGPQPFVLPPPSWHDPTAQAIAALRQAMALEPGTAQLVGAKLRFLSGAPPSAIGYGADLHLVFLADALSAGRMKPADGVAGLLVLIKEIEAGADYGPAQALAKASAALMQALRDGTPDAAILQKLLQDLQRALAAHMAALQHGQQAPPPGEQKTFDSATLDELAKKIAADQAAGRTDQAAAELRQLAAALQALQHARPMTRQEAARAEAGAKGMQALSKLIQAQAALRDKTTQGQATPADQDRLQKQLRQIGQALGQAGLAKLPGLEQAGQAMGQSSAALGTGDESGAQGAQLRAIQSLQQAMGALRNATPQSFAISPGGVSPSVRTDENIEGSGSDLEHGGVKLEDRNPADAIEREIIRRDSDPGLPAATHDYLHRLLTPDH